MIVVVGAGMTGLALGVELARAGADFVVLEALVRAGGVVRSSVVDGVVLDHGPQRMRLTEAIRPFVTACGLEDRLVVAPMGLDLFVYSRGKLRTVPLTASQLLTTDLLSPAGKLRLMLEPLVIRRDARASVADFLEGTLGREAYANIVGPLFGGLYGTDPAAMPADASLLPLLRQLGARGSLLVRALGSRGGRAVPSVSFEQGMEALPRALARSLGDRLRLGTTVRSVGEAGMGWRVETDSTFFDAETVVLTTPAAATASLLEGVAPGTAAVLRGLRYNRLAVAHLVAETDLRGMGFQMGLDEPPSLLRGVTFNESLFARPRLHTAYLGSTRISIDGFSDEALAEHAARAFLACTGFEATPVSVSRTSMPAWDFSWRALPIVRPPEGLHLAGSWRSRPGLAGRFAEARSLATRLCGGATARAPALQHALR